MDFEKLYEKAFNWIIFQGPKVFFGIIILIIGLWVIKILSKLFTRYFQERDLEPSLKYFLLSLIVIALRVFLVLGVMQVMGIQMTIFAAIVGSLGVAAGFALSGTLQNFASGVIILLLKPFVVGDHIITQNQEGMVSAIWLFYTIVTTSDNKTIIVPNSKLSNEIIVNITRQGKRRIDVEMKFNYGIEIEKIKEIINQTIDSSANILKNQKRIVGVSQIEADGFKMMINIWVSAQNFNEARLIFHERLIQNLKASGIKLPGM